MSSSEAKGTVQPCSAEVEVSDSRDGRDGQESGGVVETEGTPLMNCTDGGENQCPRPLYLFRVQLGSI
jgi:hypothetical protein